MALSACEDTWGTITSTEAAASIATADTASSGHSGRQMARRRRHTCFGDKEDGR